MRSRSVHTGHEGGCNTCTWHGQCIRYPTNARNTLFLSPSLPPRISNAPNFPITTPVRAPSCSLSLSPHPRPLPPARCPLYHPRVSFCRQMRAIRPMLNATFDSLHLRGAPHAHPFPPLPPDSSPPSRDGLCTVYASSTSTRVYRARTRSLSTRVNHERGEDRGLGGGKGCSRPPRRKE